jgi:membrane protein implicated in regulation of membrane protease activity
MKRRHWIIAAWLVVTLLLLTLGVYFVADLVQSVRQGTLLAWETELARFVAYTFVLVLSTGGFYQELRQAGKG